MAETLAQMAEAVQSREDFVRFVEALRADLEQDPASWENASLPTYLAAIGGWASDMDGFFKNHGMATPQPPSWRLMAQILSAARVYE